MYEDPAEAMETTKGADLVASFEEFAKYVKGFLEEDAFQYIREVLGADANNVSKLKKIARLIEDGQKRIGKKLTKKEVETAINIFFDNSDVESALKAIEGIRKRIFREAIQSDADIIQNLKTKYHAGKSSNVASAKGNINGDFIDLECVSGGFKHENYFNKGNFEPPMPENYYFKGPKPDFEHHTEQKIIEYLRVKYQGNSDAFGEVEIISERRYCDNCRVLVDLFEK